MKFVMTLGLATIGLAYALHFHSSLLMNSSEIIFFGIDGFASIFLICLQFVCNICISVGSAGFGLSLEVLVQNYLHYCRIFIVCP